MTLAESIAHFLEVNGVETTPSEAYAIANAKADVAWETARLLVERRGNVRQAPARTLSADEFWKTIRRAEPAPSPAGRYRGSRYASRGNWAAKRLKVTN